MQGSLGRNTIIGFIAGVIAVVTVHQGIVYLLNQQGIIPVKPWNMAGVPPWGVPTIINNIFWGGLWGALFSLIHDKLPGGALWLKGPDLWLDNRRPLELDPAAIHQRPDIRPAKSGLFCWWRAHATARRRAHPRRLRHSARHPLRSVEQPKILRSEQRKGRPSCLGRPSQTTKPVLSVGAAAAGVAHHPVPSHRPDHHLAVRRGCPCDES